MAMTGREDSTPPHITTRMQEFLRSQQPVVSSLSRLTEQVADLRGDARVRDKLALSLKEDMATLRGEMSGLRNGVHGVRNEVNGLRNDLAALRSEVRSEMDALRAEINALRAETIERFQAVGVRFDAQDTALERMERELRVLRSDVAALEIGILNGVQSALHAHRRIEEGPDSAGSPLPES